MNNRNPDVNSNTLSPRARLLCLNQDLDTSLQGLEIVLSGQAQTIGRSSENTVHVPYQRISRNHARIFPERGAWWIEDLKSTNGVFINEERISRAALLRPGDIVKVGPIAFRYAYESLSPAPQEQESATEFTRSGSQRTVYGEDARVFEMLEATREAEEDVPPPPALQEEDAKVISPSEGRNRIIRYAVIVLLAAGFSMGATYLYIHYQSEQEISAQIKKYREDFQRFINNYEVDKPGLYGPPDVNKERAELDKLLKIEAKAQKYSESLELQGLRAQIEFLKFERELDSLLKQQKIGEARALVKSTQDRLTPKEHANDERPRVLEQIIDLLSLAEIIVEFKQFSHDFPDPTDNSLRRPDPQRLETMNTPYRDLTQKVQANDSLLRTTYRYFRRILKEVIENDLRRFNRWNLLLRGDRQQ
jgi:hypothetical protein